MNDLVTAGAAIVSAIIGVAIVSVLVSNKSNTAGLVTASGSAFANILKVAVSPVTGGGTTQAAVGSASAGVSAVGGLLGGVLGSGGSDPFGGIGQVLGGGTQTSSADPFGGLGQAITLAALA